MVISDAQYLAWLKNDKALRVVLLEAKCYSGGAVITRYMSRGGYTSKPGDTPANIPYPDIITDVPDLTWQMSEAFGGRSTITWGNVGIDNSGGVRDSWLEDGWDGRAIELYLGDPSWAKSDFRHVLSGVMDDITSPAANQLALVLRDKQGALNVQLQTTLIGGTDAYAGQPAPLSYGAPYNIEPRCIDAGASTYQFNDGPSDAVTDVFDSGISLTRSGLVVSAVDAVNDLLTFSGPHGLYINSRLVLSGTVPAGITAGVTYWAIAAGLTATDCKLSATQGGAAVNITGTTTGATGVGKNWNEDLSASTITLVAKPVGRITLSPRGAKPAGTYLSTIADIANHIVTTRSGLSSADIDAANFATFNAACPQPIGFNANDRVNLMQALDAMLSSVGGFYTFSRAGLMLLGQLVEPSGTPVLSLTQHDVVQDGLRIKAIVKPRETVRVGYARNWAVQADGLASGITEAERARRGAEYLIAEYTDSGVLTVHPGALTPDMIPTLLIDGGDAAAEAQRRQELNATPRKVYELDCFTAPLQLTLGKVISLDYPRFVFNGGALAVVVGIKENLTTGRVTLDLWK